MARDLESLRVRGVLDRAKRDRELLMHSPAKQKGDAGLICCKTLRAASAPAIVKAVAPASQLLDAFTADLATAVSSRESLAQPRLVELDTGPLGLGNFAELVLQRSLRAHAPPSLG